MSKLLFSVKVNGDQGQLWSLLTFTVWKRAAWTFCLTSFSHNG